MIAIKEFQHFTFLLGSESKDIFKYFGVTELHGLSLNECVCKEDTNTSAYIAGLCNQFPTSKKYFIFINARRLNGNYKDITLINHEAMHLAFWKYDYDINHEENIITFAEQTTHQIINYLKLFNYVH